MQEELKTAQKALLHPNSLPMCLSGAPLLAPVTQHPLVCTHYLFSAQVHQFLPAEDILVTLRIDTSAMLPLFARKFDHNNDLHIGT